MGFRGVSQAQTLFAIMRGQFARHARGSLMVLGVAGGNGLEHVCPDTREIIGVDINPNYLAICAKRHVRLQRLRCLCVDLCEAEPALPHADVLIANFPVEHIGETTFANVVRKVSPCIISCAIQVDSGEQVGFVSASPNLHAFDGLSVIHHTIDEAVLSNALAAQGFRPSTYRKLWPLPNGKALLERDWVRDTSFWV